VRLELLSRDWPPNSTFLAEIDIAGRDLGMEIPVLPSPLVVRNPFGNSQLFKADPSGRWLAILTRGWDGEPTAVSVVGLEGQSGYEVAVPTSNPQLRNSDVSEWVRSSGMAEEFVEVGFFGSVPQATQAITEALDPPRHTPAVPNWGRGILEEAVFVTPEGEVFISAWAIGTSTRWFRAGPTGVEAISVPPKSQVLAARNDFVWVQQFDALDRPRVVRYRVMSQK